MQRRFVLPDACLSPRHGAVAETDARRLDVRAGGGIRRQNVRGNLMLRERSPYGCPPCGGPARHIVPILIDILEFYASPTCKVRAGESITVVFFPTQTSRGHRAQQGRRDEYNLATLIDSPILSGQFQK
jgi:hypothetical protein